ncbi:MAG: serine/threonine protein kinase [Ktedonobacteraceae bacterium]
MQEVHTTLQLGTIIRGRYVVEDVLGQRSLGTIYLARDQRNNQKLFVLREVPKPGWKDRYQAAFESMASRQPDHPALPHVYRVFNDNRLDRAFMLMDYIEGPNLEILRQGQPEQRFSLSQAMTLIAPIMDAVTHLHSQHHPITHGNIKPSNIIMRKEGAATVLVGYSIAHKSGTDPTSPFDRHITPGYQAPEQYSRGADPRTDIYALGAVLYTLLTGTVPVDALYRLAQLGERKPDPLLPMNQITPGVPTTIAGAIHRAMSIHSNDRFSSVEQFWNGLWQVSSINPVDQPIWVPVEQPRVEEGNELDANPTLEDTPGRMVPPSSGESKESEEVKKPASEPLQKQPQSPQFKKPGNTFFIPLK